MFVPKLEELVPIVRPAKGALQEIVLADGAIDPLLFKLIELRTPYGAERPIINIIAERVTKYLRMPNKCLLFDGHGDQVGNLIVHVGNKDKHKTLFSCHIDTIHKDAGRNRLWIMDSGFLYATDERGNPAPLGADDKAGAWIMCKMIEAQIEGLYVFHFGEEKGRLGSKRFMLNNRKLLGSISHAIGFDRKGYGEIITHQLNDETCSEEFAEALAETLNSFVVEGSTDASDTQISWMPNSITWHPDNTGLYTDTYTYRDLVPECTNVSIGYHHQHSNDECLDTYILHHFLLPAFKAVKWRDLPTARKINRATHGRLSKKEKATTIRDMADMGDAYSRADAVRRFEETSKKEVERREEAAKWRQDREAAAKAVKEEKEHITSRASAAGANDNVYKMYPSFDPDVGDPLDDIPRFVEEDEELAGKYKEKQHDHLWEKNEKGNWSLNFEKLREEMEREKEQQIDLQATPDKPVTSEEYDLWKDGLAQGKTRKEQLDLIHQWILARTEAEASTVIMRLLIERKESWQLKQFAEDELIKARAKLELLPGQEEYITTLEQMEETTRQIKMLEEANQAHLMRLNNYVGRLTETNRANEYLNNMLRKYTTEHHAVIEDFEKASKQAM